METKRHIHMIYRSSDGQIHCEQYPVVYRNKHYIYYKRPGHNQLDYISYEPREQITLEDIDDITIRLKNHRWVRYVTWSIEDDVRDKLIHSVNDLELVDLYSELDKYESELENAKLIYERAERNYNFTMNRIQIMRNTEEDNV